MLPLQENEHLDFELYDLWSLQNGPAKSFVLSHESLFELAMRCEAESDPRRPQNRRYGGAENFAGSQSTAGRLARPVVYAHRSSTGNCGGLMAFEKYVTDSPASQFLRSINVELDAEFVDRIAHYQPTRKNIALTEALLGYGQDRSFVVVAPYGSGKSLTAAYALHLIENRTTSREVLKAIEDQSSGLDQGLATFSRLRRRSETKGLAVVLTGEQKHLGNALYEAVLNSMSRCGLGKQARTLRRLADNLVNDTGSMLHVLEEKLSAAGYDRMSIIWDEFGRHLEGLISNGRSQDLMQVQQLAEMVTRTTTVPTTIALLQHQTMLHYAGGLPQAARSEWKKVEGRFCQIQFVDDSYEISQLDCPERCIEGSPRRSRTSDHKGSCAGSLGNRLVQRVFKDRDIRSRFTGCPSRTSGVVPPAQDLGEGRPE